MKISTFSSKSLFSMSTVIEVDDVWKKYRLGIIGTGSLRHDFERWWHRVRGKPDPHAKVGAAPSAKGAGAKVASPDLTPSNLTPLNGAESDLGDDEVWALRGVSFEVKQGEILGIIGRNGAGKSTLLKILSRVTAPTNGEVRVKGRTASLLEVGTGFHPELTGRENIFLNGAILGMTKAEIRTKLAEIVAFAEIKKFLDTPVKRYSSGMYVRLAFAVAAHLEPDILIVDEVLAVGDAQFQKKCLGKIRSVAQGGRTVLFVSHNLAALKAICSRAILLNDGRVQLDASSQDTVSRYLNEHVSSRYLAPKSKHGSPHVTRLWFSDPAGLPKDSFHEGDPIAVNVDVHNPRHESLELTFAFFNTEGNKLWNFTHAQHNLPPIEDENARIRITFFIPPIHVHEVFAHVGLRIKGPYMGCYVDHITEGLRFLIDEPTGGTYEQMDSILRCSVEFQMLP